MKHNKLIAASITGFVSGMVLMALIGFLPLKNASYWQGRYIGALEKMADMQEELEVYHINQAQIQAYDKQVWQGFTSDMITDSLEWKGTVIYYQRYYQPNTLKPDEEGE